MIYPLINNFEDTFKYTDQQVRDAKITLIGCTAIAVTAFISTIIFTASPIALAVTSILLTGSLISLVIFLPDYLKNPRVKGILKKNYIDDYLIVGMSPYISKSSDNNQMKSLAKEEVTVAIVNKVFEGTTTFSLNDFTFKIVESEREITISEKRPQRFLKSCHLNKNYSDLSHDLQKDVQEITLSTLKTMKNAGILRIIKRVDDVTFDVYDNKNGTLEKFHELFEETNFGELKAENFYHKGLPDLFINFEFKISFWELANLIIEEIDQIITKKKTYTSDYRRGSVIGEYSEDLKKYLKSDKYQDKLTFKKILNALVENNYLYSYKRQVDGSISFQA